MGRTQEELSNDHRNHLITTWSRVIPSVLKRAAVFIRPRVGRRNLLRSSFLEAAGRATKYTVSRMILDVSMRSCVDFSFNWCLFASFAANRFDLCLAA